MNKNVKIAKQLIKLAQDLVAMHPLQKLQFYQSPRNDKAKFSKKFDDVVYSLMGRIDKWQKFFNKPIKKKDFESTIQFKTEIIDELGKEGNLLTSAKVGMEINPVGTYVNSDNNKLPIPSMYFSLNMYLTGTGEINYYSDIKYGSESLSSGNVFQNSISLEDPKAAKQKLAGELNKSVAILSDKLQQETEGKTRVASSFARIAIARLQGIFNACMLIED